MANQIYRNNSFNLPIFFINKIALLLLLNSIPAKVPINPINIAVIVIALGNIDSAEAKLNFKNIPIAVVNAAITSG